MAVRFPLEKFLLISVALVLLFSIECSIAKPREIRRARNKTLETFRTINGNGVTGILPNPEKRIHDRAREIQCLTSGISSIIGSITQSLTSILGGVKNSTSGLGNLKPGGGGGGFDISAIFSKPGGCGGLDPLLIANIPGIFFWTPVVILAISILVGIVAAIAIALGVLGSNITEAIYDAIKEKMNPGGYEESSSYGVPSSSYGSTGSTYSRLETVNQLTDNFYQASDKYSALSQQPQDIQYQTEQQRQPQNKQQIFQDYHENQSQYDKWNQIGRAKSG